MNILSVNTNLHGHINPTLGLGSAASMQELSTQTLREKVCCLVEDEGIQRNCRGIALEMQHMGGMGYVADELERFVDQWTGREKPEANCTHFD